MDSDICRQHPRFRRIVEFQSRERVGTDKNNWRGQQFESNFVKYTKADSQVDSGEEDRDSFLIWDREKRWGNFQKIEETQMFAIFIVEMKAARNWLLVIQQRWYIINYNNML